MCHESTHLAIGRRLRTGRWPILALLAVFTGACSTVPVATDPATAPSFASSILWLNDYFRANDIAVRVAENRVHYSEQRSDSHSGGALSYPWYMLSKDVHFQYVNGSILLLRRVTVFARFDVDDDTTAQKVIQRLVATGLKFNQAGRIRSYACTAGQTDQCPKYPDDGSNRTVDPATAPCWEKKCRSPK